ncbi:MAG: DUF3313 family protein [Myxococcota bacterium]|nr:DUF3313 family protein [Myxococcota bacterium]
MKSFGLGLPLFLALCLMGCASGSGSGSGGDKVYYATGKGAVTPDGLHRIKWEPFAATFVKPGANLGNYDAVILEEVTISYQRPPRKNVMPGELNGLNDNFALSSQATGYMKKYFHEAFVKELAKSSDFKIVTEPGPNVLRIAGHIVGLVITVPPQNQQLADESVYSSSSGAMTLVLDADDSVTGEPLVRVGQRNDIGNGFDQFYESNPVENSGAVRQVFDKWAMDLRQELDQFKALKEVPAP